MFLLKQFIKSVLLPPTLWLILLLAVLVFWEKGWARKLLLGTFLLILALHSGLFAQLAGYSLESRFAPLRDCRAAAPHDAIVVLMSGVIEPSGLIPFPAIDRATFARLDEAWRLYRCDPKPIIASGGYAGPDTHPEIVNGVMRDYLIRWGVPPQHIIQEAESRDTFESAVAVGKIIRLKGWRRYLLVTSALHMPRSMMVFRALAPEPVAAPGDFRVARLLLDPLSFFPKEESANKSYEVIHEYLGLLNYRLRLLAGPGR
jgi:uncharacterized SAM-binding protein YcdF (DUF218 family)